MFKLRSNNAYLLPRDLNVHLAVRQTTTSILTFFNVLSSVTFCLPKKHDSSHSCMHVLGSTRLSMSYIGGMLNNILVNYVLTFIDRL